jgi:hypothetical protein
MDDIVPTEHVYLGSLALSPEAVVERASRIATALAKIIKDRHLSKKIGPSEHVLVEAWLTLGALVGISAKEREVRHTVDAEGVHEYEAYVDLVRTDTGIVVGGGSAICRTDEPNWKAKPLYAVRSMAITRATGKAFRIKLAFIVELAGFATTPAEEMDIVEGHVVESPRLINGKKAASSTDDPAKVAFRQVLGRAKLTHEEGQAILRDCANDFAMATKKVEEQYLKGPES